MVEVVPFVLLLAVEVCVNFKNTNTRLGVCRKSTHLQLFRFFSVAEAALHGFRESTFDPASLTKTLILPAAETQTESEDGVHLKRDRVTL